MANFCPNCGQQLNENQKFCNNCGTATGNAGNNVNNGSYYNGAANSQMNAQYNNMGTQYNNPNASYNNNMNNAYGGYNAQPQLPMNWFKFVIYFQLFAACVLNVFTGIAQLTGSLYEAQGINASFVYAFFPGLSAVDKIYGIICIALGVAAIIVRQKLAKFCQDGPKFYLIYLAVTVVASIIYLVAVIAIVGEMETSTTIGSLIGNGIMLVCNKIYFDKRAHLFVN